MGQRRGRGIEEGGRGGEEGVEEREWDRGGGGG